ncbi:hypothetical protein GCM10017083_48930 [Thalassobaculum fulvum]|uniref:Uncharacterized protein n=1 Tax=Thalassobaculum fulvum TaxID=1633335 RepID=A0A919CTH7_9PROT|nr:hypothetical protein [Thalassobaculum fulvum]GHD61508.1 hypothetical protein GCM10017083_48930 [Thalassobaculum fulvum]
MSLLRRLIFEAGRRAAQNPEVRRTAARVAGEVYGKVAPRVENAGRHVLESARETSAEGRLTDDPIGFARRFRDRLLPPEDDRQR